MSSPLMTGSVCDNRRIQPISVSNLTRRTAYQCEVRRTAESAWALLISFQATSSSCRKFFPTTRNEAESNHAEHHYQHLYYWTLP